MLTAHNGEKVDVNGIKPTKTQTIFDKMDIDGVIHEYENPISSGQLSFREVLPVIPASNKSCDEKFRCEWRTWPRDAEGLTGLVGCRGS